MIPPRRARLERWIAHSESRIQALAECIDLLDKAGQPGAARLLKPLLRTATQRQGYLLRCLVPNVLLNWATPRFFLFTGPGVPAEPLPKHAAY